MAIHGKRNPASPVGQIDSERCTTCPRQCPAWAGHSCKTCSCKPLLRCAAREMLSLPPPPALARGVCSHWQSRLVQAVMTAAPHSQQHPRSSLDCSRALVVLARHAQQHPAAQRGHTASSTPTSISGADSPTELPVSRRLGMGGRPAPALGPACSPAAAPLLAGSGTSPAPPAAGEAVPAGEGGGSSRPPTL